MEKDPLLELDKDVAKVKVSAVLHKIVHNLHDTSDVLLDDNKLNDQDALRQFGNLLQDAVKYYQIRMNL